MAIGPRRKVRWRDADVNRGVEMFLLVKDTGAWRIAAQAWDTERDGRRLPADLLKPVKPA
jgi:hypothetical protein